MAVALVNPYVSLADVKAELKMPAADVQYDDTILTAINLASRWVDEYRGRDFFGHDYIDTPYIVDRFSDSVFDEMLFLPWIARFLQEVKEIGVVLQLDTHYTYRRLVTAPAYDRRLWRLGGKWSVGEPATNVIEIKGQFGGDQWESGVLHPDIVPKDIPGPINLAAKLVAAALSGHNRKEVAGLDGGKLEIHDNRIPKTVFDMLGRRAIVL